MENEETIKKPFNCYFAILITQFVTVLIIILSLLVIKYFFKPTFKNINRFYEKNICQEVSISEVIDEI